MKKITTIVLALMAFVVSGYAQCVPDTTHFTATQFVYPSSIPCIVQGTAYSQVVSIVVPDSLPASDFVTGVPGNFYVQIDSININSIVGYPTNMSSSSSPSLGSWIPVRGHACALFTGTTTDPIGSYPLIISGIGCGHITIFGTRHDSCMNYTFSNIFPVDLQVCNTVCSNVIDTTRRTICTGDSILWGSVYHKRRGTFVDTVMLTTGCDSLHVLVLSTLNPPRAGRATVRGCGSITLGGITFSHDTVVTVALHGAAANGCDSSVRYTVRLGGVVKPVITETGNTLQTNYPAANVFQWYMNGSSITGATSASYSTAGALGSYVVATDSLGCRDTSAAFNLTGIFDPGVQNTKLYPNPNNGSFILESHGVRGSTYTITNALGEMIEQNLITGDKQEIRLVNVPAGVYTLSMKGSRPVSFTVAR